MMAAAMATKGKDKLAPHGASNIEEFDTMLMVALSREPISLKTLAMLGVPLELMANSM
jgi:hypothetical protein